MPAPALVYKNYLAFLVLGLAAFLSLTIDAASSTTTVEHGNMYLDHSQSFRDITLNVRNDIYVTNSSFIVMEKVNLIFNRTDFNHSILVDQNSRLQIVNSTITTTNETGGYYFQIIDAYLTITNSNLSLLTYPSTLLAEGKVGSIDIFNSSLTIDSSRLRVDKRLIKAEASVVTLSNLNLSLSVTGVDMEMQEGLYAYNSIININSVDFNWIGFPIVLETSSATINNSTFYSNIYAIRIHDSTATINGTVIEKSFFQGIESWNSEIFIDRSRFSSMAEVTPDTHIAGLFASYSSGKITNSIFSNLPVGITATSSLVHEERMGDENIWLLDPINEFKVFIVENNSFENNGIGFRGVTGILKNNQFTNNSIDIVSLGHELITDRNIHSRTIDYLFVQERVLKIGTQPYSGTAPITFEITNQYGEKIASGTDWQGWLSSYQLEGFDPLDTCACLLAVWKILPGGSIIDHNPLTIRVVHPRYGSNTTVINLTKNTILFIDMVASSLPDFFIEKVEVSNVRLNQKATFTVIVGNQGRSTPNDTTLSVSFGGAPQTYFIGPLGPGENFSVEVTYTPTQDKNVTLWISINPDDNVKESNYQNNQFFMIYPLEQSENQNIGINFWISIISLCLAVKLRFRQRHRFQSPAPIPADGSRHEN